MNGENLLEQLDTAIDRYQRAEKALVAHAHAARLYHELPADVLTHAADCAYRRNVGECSCGLNEFMAAMDDLTPYR